jgi:hypothetical protein
MYMRVMASSAPLSPASEAAREKGERRRGGVADSQTRQGEEKKRIRANQSFGGEATNQYDTQKQETIGFRW